MDRVLNDLIKDNESVKEDMYNARVNALIRQKYSQDKVEAIIANYLSYLSGESGNANYKTEYFEFQKYRQECKETAKNETNDFA
ncbi:MAG TPA: hypothetical protein DCQ76_02140 [Ruminococcaceae bacterium]|nr:hypothetical protein [Oscillospiraceae bacterium]